MRHSTGRDEQLPNDRANSATELKFRELTRDLDGLLDTLEDTHNGKMRHRLHTLAAQKALCAALLIPDLEA
jgi:hypothetical protein